MILHYHKFRISVFIQHGLSGFSSVASRRKGSDGAEVGILMEKVPTPILPRDPENKQMRLGPQFTGTALRYKEALSSVLKHLKGQEKEGEEWIHLQEKVKDSPLLSPF